MKIRIMLVMTMWLAAVLACGGQEATPTGPSPRATMIAATATVAPLGPVVNTGANLRAGPGTEYDVIGSAAAGQVVEPVARNEAGDWLQLAGGAWIAAFLVDGAPGDLPVANDIPPLPGKAPAVAPAPTGPAPEALNCDCSGDVYNCSDALADRCFYECLAQTGRDVHGLDADRDGMPCERN